MGSQLLGVHIRLDTFRIGFFHFSNIILGQRLLSFEAYLSYYFGITKEKEKANLFS